LGADGFIENRTFDEIAVGDDASLTRIFAREDLDYFALITGDAGPSLTDAVGKNACLYSQTVIHGLFISGLISSLLGTKLPGLGTIHQEQTLKFLGVVEIGDSITATIIARTKELATSRILFDCRCVNQNGQCVAEGACWVLAPKEKIRLPRMELPDVQLSRHQRFRALLARAAGLKPMTTAIAYPCDANAIGAAVEAAQAGLIAPILVGPKAKIEAAAREARVEIASYRQLDAPDSVGAAVAAVALVTRGEAQLLMKGSLHTDELLHAVLAPESNLHTGRRLSHVYLFDVPSYPKPLLVTDAAVNIAPDVEEKRDIIQNAIDLAHMMGIAEPKVALLSAVETINPKIKSTLDAAALCKMAERGQIRGGVLDGPLAFDNAISPAAAAEKGIVSPVAGQADILLVPDLEAGNMLAKQLSFFAGADAAGVVLGARVPIILTSRADAERTRMASCAVAVLIAQKAKTPA